METTATLNGTVNANNQAATVSFEYGTTTSYGFSADGVPATVDGGAVTPVSAAISGLEINTTYHFRAKATNTNGTTYGEDMTFTTSCPIPGQAGEISGPTEVCSNNGTYNYSVDPIAYATNYLWSLPSGASIVSGDGTNGITVQFAPGAVSGDMSVFGSNDCGDGDASNPLSVVVTEPVVVSVSIAASANPVSSGTPVTFTATPVNGGTTPLYTWKINGTYQTPQTDPTYTYVPANGDSIICFLFSDISCNTGNPATSNQILMTVSGPPADIIVTGALLSGQTECYDATNTITVAGTGTTFSVASGATATMIAGSKISYLPGTTVASGGHMHGYIAPTGPWCPAAPEFKVIAAEQEKVVEILDNTFRIYPNPTTGAFTVEREGDDVASPVQVEVISIMGSRIISNNFSNFIKQDFNILGNQPGVYFVKITSGAKTQTVKILLTR
jgi:hypothetical protein